MDEKTCRTNNICINALKSFYISKTVAHENNIIALLLHNCTLALMFDTAVSNILFTKGEFVFNTYTFNGAYTNIGT